VLSLWQMGNCEPWQWHKRVAFTRLHEKQTTVGRFDAPTPNPTLFPQPFIRAAFSRIAYPRHDMIFPRYTRKSP